MNVETVLAGRLSPVSPDNASVSSSSVSSVQFRVRRDDRRPSTACDGSAAYAVSDCVVS